MKIIILINLLLALTACTNKHDVCIKKGIQYYQDIGSYPKLSSEDVYADDKIKQTCSSNPNAFD